MLAIDLMKKKYGNKAELVRVLQKRLERESRQTLDPRAKEAAGIYYSLGYAATQNSNLFWGVAASRSMRERNEQSQRKDFGRIKEIEDDIEDLETTLYNLDVEKTCDPRDFKKGVIRRKEDLTVPCVFCGRVGDHTPTHVPYIRITGREIILSTQRIVAESALRTNFDEHTCRRITACFHCKKHGHHSALCDLPERSKEIRRRYEEATRKRREAKRRNMQNGIPQNRGGRMASPRADLRAESFTMDRDITPTGSERRARSQSGRGRPRIHPVGRERQNRRAAEDPVQRAARLEANAMRHKEEREKPLMSELRE
ncbi:hypothetical protein COOONC_22699 [Cooperia oncophora]